MRILIVDDENVARQYLRDLLEAEGDVEIVGECRDGEEALACLREQAVDVVFLDVKMPGLDGFEVARRMIDDELDIAIVFVTAYDAFALEAFEVHAVDYLLKPFDGERLARTLAHLRPRLRRVESVEVTGRLEAALDAIARRSAPAFVTAHDQGRVRMIALEDVHWCAAAGNYVEVRTADETHLVRTTLSALEDRLDPHRFLRIHRSTVVRLDQVDSLEPTGHGDLRVRMRDGQEFVLSRRYRDRLQRRLDGAS